jgi:hypothetical protein
MDKDALLKSSIPEREVEIPGKGTVRVRGLSRHEYLQMGIIGKEDLDKAEIYMLRLGLVDPSLSSAEVAQWRREAAAGEVDPVTDAINALSGLGEHAVRDAAQSFRGRSGDAPGVPPSEGAGHDGGAAAG